MSQYSKEDARRVLHENPKMFEEHKAYWLAIANETLPDYYHSEFVRRRDTYSDDLPDFDVRDLVTTRGVRTTAYKCQGNFLAGLGSHLQSAIKDGVIKDQQVQDDIGSFLESDLAFTVGDPKNQERIDRINATLNTVIGYLEAQYQV